MERKALIARGRSLVKPCSLAGSRWEPAAAGLCGAMLAGVFGTELLTPDDVVGSLGLPPLLAALWTLSGRFVAAVSAFALALFAAVLALEASNRSTVLAVGVTGLVLALSVRKVAMALAPVQGPPNREVPRGFESLTRRELEVARLASEGYTAAEVGARLHISERTVETHLAHVYAKIGVTSKRALVRMGDRLAGRSR